MRDANTREAHKEARWRHFRQVLLPAVSGGQDGGAQGSVQPAGRRGPGAAARGRGPTAESAQQVRPRAAPDALPPGLGFLESGNSTGPMTPWERMTQARDPSPWPALSGSRILEQVPVPEEGGKIVSARSARDEIIWKETLPLSISGNVTHPPNALLLLPTPSGLGVTGEKSP